MKPRVLLRQDKKMPISPKEIAEKRLETTITKLCDIIDKKLQESENLPFEFTFHSNTDPQVQTKIADIYRQAGWSASLIFKTDNQNGVLVLNTQEAINESATQIIKESLSNVSNIVESGNNINVENETDILTTTLDGRIALAMAMTEPIKTSLMYQALSRKIFAVDELVSNEYPNYDTKEGAIFYTKGQTIKPYLGQITDDDFCEIGAGVEYDIPLRNFTFDKTAISLKESLLGQENAITLKLLSAAATFEQTIYTYHQTLNLAVLDSIAELEDSGMFAAKIIMHPKTFSRVFRGDMFRDVFDEANRKNFLMMGVYGHLYNMDVHVCVKMPLDEIYITAPAHYVGTWLVKSTHVMSSDSHNKTEGTSKPGFMARNIILPILLNPTAVRKIMIRW